VHVDRLARLARPRVDRGEGVAPVVVDPQRLQVPGGDDVLGLPPTGMVSMTLYVFGSITETVLESVLGT
jgi:hypothetical protein